MNIPPGWKTEALLLKVHISESFDAIVTGAADKGAWVRQLTAPVEEKLVSGFVGLDVGDRVRVQLTATNVERGFTKTKKIPPLGAG